MEAGNTKRPGASCWLTGSGMRVSGPGSWEKTGRQTTAVSKLRTSFLMVLDVLFKSGRNRDHKDKVVLIGKL
jgi:hypothetical protein